MKIKNQNKDWFIVWIGIQFHQNEPNQSQNKYDSDKHTYRKNT